MTDVETLDRAFHAVMMRMVEMRDDEILSISPPTIVGYSRSAVGGDADTRAFR